MKQFGLIAGVLGVVPGLVGVLQANRMLASLRQRDNPHRDDAIRLIDDAVAYAHGADAHGPWLGPALQKIADALLRRQAVQSARLNSVFAFPRCSTRIRSSARPLRECWPTTSTWKETR